MNNNYWVLNGSGSLPNTEKSYDTSTRIDHKRNHQWFMVTTEHELLLNKKQAIESVNKNVSTTVTDFVNMEKKGYQSQFGNNLSICLTMPNAVESPLCLNTGLRKVKDNQVVGDQSQSCLPEFVEPTLYPGEKNKVTGPTFHRTGNNICPGPTYNTNTDANIISAGPDFSKMDKNFISAGQASSKRDGNFKQYFNGMDNNMLSIGQAFNIRNYNINAVGEQYEKENRNFMSIGPTYNKGHENFFTVDPFNNKSNEMFSSSGLPMVDSYTKGQQTTINFGGFMDNNYEDNNPAGGLVRSYDIIPNQSSGIDSAEHPSENVVSDTTSKAAGAQKAKEPKTKKGSSNNFPSNVKSLLSTGILDGVPVKYVSWSREKNLRGVVKGTGYLCSCQDCKLNKVINAYEFERHAGCKTKHPNNHIYFENGKTIYAVVQELKSTPQETLFEVIPNVTGSSVNQKNFETWKASFKAAALELQRIYRQDEVIVQS